MNSFEVFPWNINFETGIPEIDEQHKKLVHLLNILTNHLAYQSDNPTLDNVFKELSDYAVYHFQTEENIWHQFFPGDVWESDHRKLHSSFMSEVLRLKSRENTESVNAVFEDILSFLTHWLAFHILEDDKRMAKAALAVKAGLSVAEARTQAAQEMSGAMKVLVETILSMYDTLSNRTLQLMKEVIDRQKAETKLRLAANAIEHTLEAICITDENYNVIEVNPAFYQTTMSPPSEVLGRNLKELKTGLQDEKLDLLIKEALHKNGHWSGEVWSRTKKGEMDAEWLTLSAITDDHGVINNYVGVFSNISNLIQQRSKLELSANYDVLTGLPNRLLLSDRMDLAIARADRNHCFLAVCYLDLDGFKEVNDRFGHASGDKLLWEIAQRFLKIIRNNDTAVRLGGDEFIILFSDLKKPKDCTKLLDRLLKEVERPVDLTTDIALVTASIGVTIYPQKGCNRENLLQFSDQAMYQAKKSGKSRYSFYQP